MLILFHTKISIVGNAIYTPDDYKYIYVYMHSGHSN